MKAQAGLEFITTYGWALLIILVLAAAAYYFLASRPVPSQCDFGVTSPCIVYQLFNRADGSIRLRVQFTNGLGRAISLFGSMVVTVNNVGKSGVNNYTGVCRGPDWVTQGGDVISCYVDIADKNVVPAVGAPITFGISLNYTDCGTDKNFPITCFGDNRTLHGRIVTPLEGLNYTAPYCMDGVCSTGENYTNCPWDCPPPTPKCIQVHSTACCMPLCALNKDTGVEQINVTVYSDSYCNSMYKLPGALVKVYPIDYTAIYVGIDKHLTAYIITPSIGKTDANGMAQFNFSWNSCDCCFKNCLVAFTYKAVSGNAIGYDTAGCAVLNFSRDYNYNLHCC